MTAECRMCARLVCALILVLIALTTGAVKAAGGNEAEPPVLPKIDRHPKPADFKRGRLQTLPKHQPGSSNPFEVDLRSYDLSELDMSSAADDLVFGSFDDRMIWLPQGLWRKSSRNTAPRALCQGIFPRKC